MRRLLKLFALLVLLLLVPGSPVAPAPVSGAKIALLHMYNGASFFQRLGRLTGANKRRYAARWGYDFVEVSPVKVEGILKSDGTQDSTFGIDTARAPTFGKIKMAMAACTGRDGGWLLWSDADAMVVNMSVPLESVIDDGYDVMLAYDWLMLNAGMLLLKCSDWTMGFLKEVYDAREFDQARALDQSSFQSHLDGLSAETRDAHVKILPKHAINVYIEEYVPGDFLLHMAGKLYEATEEGLWAIANQFDILSGVDDIEDIAAFFDHKHLLNYYSGTCKVKAGTRQSECPPHDPRRIILNETLGSMSSPNRYRHVGMRYYWLGDWKDQYDVPGWNNKRKSLPLPVDRGPPPPAYAVAAAVADKAPSIADGIAPVARENDEKTRNKVPVGDGGVGAAIGKGDDDDKDDGTDDDDDGDDHDDDFVWPMYVWFIMGCCVVTALSAVGLGVYRRQRRSSLKTQ